LQLTRSPFPGGTAKGDYWPLAILRSSRSPRSVFSRAGCRWDTRQQRPRQSLRGTGQPGGCRRPFTPRLDGLGTICSDGQDARLRVFVSVLPRRHDPTCACGVTAPGKRKANEGVAPSPLSGSGDLSQQPHRDVLAAPAWATSLKKDVKPARHRLRAVNSQRRRKVVVGWAGTTC